MWRDHRAGSSCAAGSAAGPIRGSRFAHGSSSGSGFPFAGRQAGRRSCRTPMDVDRRAARDSDPRDRPAPCSCAEPEPSVRPAVVRRGGKRRANRTSRYGPWALPDVNDKATQAIPAELSAQTTETRGMSAAIILICWKTARSRSWKLGLLTRRKGGSPLRYCRWRARDCRTSSRSALPRRAGRPRTIRGARCGAAAWQDRRHRAARSRDRCSRPASGSPFEPAGFLAHRPKASSQGR